MQLYIVFRNQYHATHVHTCPFIGRKAAIDFAINRAYQLRTENFVEFTLTTNKEDLSACQWIELPKWRVNIDTLEKREAVKMPINKHKNGYGGKINTGRQVFYAGRWRVVWARCYSNAATLYLLHKNKEVILY